MDENGEPEILLNVFIYDLKLNAAQYVVGKHETNEPDCFKEHLPEILKHFPRLGAVYAFLTNGAVSVSRL